MRARLRDPGGHAPGRHDPGARDPVSSRRALALVAAALVTAAVVLPAPFLVPLAEETPVAVDVPATSLPAYVVGPRVVLTEKAPTDHPATGVPVRVTIPSLEVRVPVVAVAMEGGELTPPADPQLLGWWDAGALPGAATGSALVTGHTVSVGGGALDDLGTLVSGDRVVVTTGKGRIEYDVTDVLVYTKGSLARAAQRLFSQTVQGRLALVTCSDWNGSVYLTNTVVLAVPSA